MMSQVRLVHWNQAARKVVCCRKGEEVLFPTADEFVTDWVDPILDATRCGAYAGLDWSQLTARYPDCLPVRFEMQAQEQGAGAVYPTCRIPFKPKLRGLKTTVLLGPRRRDWAQDRNWMHWSKVAEALHAHGIDFAVIGRKETALDLPHQSLHSGDYADTDAAIELLQQPNTVYLGTDSGISHLAATVGARMIVFRRDSGTNGFPRMLEVNAGRVEVLPNGWDNPDSVITALLKTVRLWLPDAIYCLSLDSKPARYREVEAAVKKTCLAGVPLRRWRARLSQEMIVPDWWVDSARRNIGLPRDHPAIAAHYATARDHLTILEEAYAEGLQTVMILEDDAVFLKCFDERFREASRLLPDNWQGLWIGTDYDRAGPIDARNPQVSPGLHVFKTHAPCHAYMLSRSGMRTVFSHCLRHEQLIDFNMSAMRRNRNDFYAPPVNTIVQSGGRGNTDDRRAIVVPKDQLL